MSTNSYFLFRIISVLLLITPSFSFASDGSISGVVKDPDGALVAEQLLVITDIASHSKITAKTGKMGTFGPLALPIGEYRLQIRADCFKDYSKIISIADGQALHLEISLKLSCPKDAGEK